jgi:hypothetical protein
MAMLSSTSSSSLIADKHPGLVQPVPERVIPAQPWRAISFAAFALLLVLLTAWEWRMRALQLTPGDLADSASAWAEQRRRVTDDPAQIVIVGDSRILFGSSLDRFAELTGTRPIQLALTGAHSFPLLQDLADNSGFRGLAIVGISELKYFGSGDAVTRAALERFRSESPSQRSGYLLQRELERWFAFLDDAYRLSHLLLRLDRGWRAQARGPYQDVWKIGVGGDDRQTSLWERIETDSDLRKHAIAAWIYDPVPPFTDEAIQLTLDATRSAVQIIRARGGEVVFLRPPSARQFRFGEEMHLPRERGWDALLKAAGVAGVHFEDHASMQGLKTPEYSHLSRTCARVYTDAYVRALAALTPRLMLRPDAPAVLAPDDC